MKLALLAIIPALAVSGCQTTAQIDAWFAKNKPKICSGIVTQHGLFRIGVRTGEVPQIYEDLEAKMYSRAMVVCNNPNAAVTDALIAAADAYREVLKKAKKK